jgi:hypothetical protein
MGVFMFKTFKKRKVVNLKENSLLDIDIMKTLGNTEIAKLETENDVLNAENKTLGLRHENIVLHNENTIFDRLKDSGTVLNILSLLSFFVSTLLSFISGYFVIKHLVKFIGYALTILICQLIIFVSARYSTVTKDKFFHKYLGLKFMQISMLLVSIIMNVIFIYECFNSLLMVFIMFPLCFILDYSTIYFSNLGHDYKTLTFHKRDNNKTIFDMMFDNFTHNFKTKIINTYNQNHSKKIDPGEEKIIVKVVENLPQIEDKKFNEILEQNEQILEVESKQETKEILEEKPNQENDIILPEKSSKNDSKNLRTNFNGKVCDIKRIQWKKNNSDLSTKQNEKPIVNLVKKDSITLIKKVDKNSNTKYKKIRTFLEQNYNPNDCINSSEIKKKFKLTISEYRKILEQLKSDNIVYTDNKKTYMSSKLKAVK